MQPKFLILLVDDDPLLLEVVNRASRNSFQEASFVQVYSAPEAKTYITALDSYGPKLILLDIDLGFNQSGFEFAAFMHLHPEGRFLPIVILTMDQAPNNIGSAYRNGVSSYTVKPSSFEDWKSYFAHLRDYWFSTVTIPPVRFNKVA